MPTFSGTFSGFVDIQQAVTVGDRDGHVMMVARVRGAQRGYFVNTHTDGGRDSGTFEGAVTTVGTELHCEGTWETTAGSGVYEGITGRGTFSMRITSPETVEASWDGVYELGVAAAG